MKQLLEDLARLLQSKVEPSTLLSCSCREVNLGPVFYVDKIGEFGRDCGDLRDYQSQPHWSEYSRQLPPIWLLSALRPGTTEQ